MRNDIIWAVVISVLVLIVAAACSAAVAANKGGAFASVVSAEDYKGRIVCSAVKVAPGVAWAAAHCAGSIYTIDGRPIATLVLSPSADAAVAYVPGLACPCAVPGKALVGELVVSAGFGSPGLSRVATVIDVATPAEHNIPVPPVLASTTFVFISPATLDPGDSGGGTFTVRDGTLILVGINSISLTPVGLDISGVVPVDRFYELEAAWNSQKRFKTEQISSPALIAPAPR